MWMCLPELNTARSNATGVIMVDHLYIFGGKNEKGYVRQIERLNLKNINSKFESLELTLPHSGACDIGVVPMSAQNNSYAEVMLIGGYNGQSLSSRFKFTASLSSSAFNDNSQGGVATDHTIEEITLGGEMKADFFSGQTMFQVVSKDGLNSTTVLGATKKHIFNEFKFVESQ